MKGYVGKVRKAVIPAAGLGTRFLPATKAMPKEMLPIIDKPVIHYVVEEAVASGIKQILIVTGRGKRSIEDYFDISVELELMLKKAGKIKQFKEIQQISELAEIFYIRQKEQRGLGDAIRYARSFVDNEPFAVLLGDTIIDSTIPCTRMAADLYSRYKGCIIAVEKVPRERIQRYGIVVGSKRGNIIEAEQLIEKPKPEAASSNLAITGRYILTPEIFDALERTKPGVGDEIQLTDALQLLLKKQKIYTFVIDGKRYDIGSKADYLEAIVEFGLRRPEFGLQFRQLLRRMVK